VSRVKYKKQAIKALLKMPRPLADRFRQAFQRIADDETRGLDLKKLQATEGLRLRIGSYRAILEIMDGDVRVLVLDIGPRGGVYK